MMDTRAIARRIAEEAIVLLKNEEKVLPFPKGQKVAFLGRAQFNTIYSGNGSGAAHASKRRNILDACEEKGICAEPGLKTYYQSIPKDEKTTIYDEFDWSNPKEMVNSGIMYEIFGRYRQPDAEYQISEECLHNASAYTDTAVLIIGRNSGGEECDRHLQGDYYLTNSEKTLIEQVCYSFKRIVLILNINGLIDLSWTAKYESIKSILFIGIPGEEGAVALADILVGNVSPSGKLSVTIAEKYEDYPSAMDFTWDKENSEALLTYESYGLDAKENGSTGYMKSPVTVYREDIYAGYRYFDTFGKKPLFAFGHGLSYTEFDITFVEAVKKTDGVEIIVTVKNIGEKPGKEVVQLYLAVCGSGRLRPYQELKGFEKTNNLNPGEQEQISLFLPWRDCACYEEEKASYIIGQGEYQLRIGNSSRNTRYILNVLVEQDINVEQCRNRLGIQTCNQRKLDFLAPADTLSENVILTQSIPGVVDSKLCWHLSLEDVKITVPSDKEVFATDIIDKVKNLSIEQLAALCVGYGPGTPFSAFGDGSDPETIFDEQGMPLTSNSHPVGFNGYVSPAIQEKGIESIFYKDGPAGIGEIAWPTEMLIACAFDKKLWYVFGNAAGEECEKQQVDIWLAPAVNLHRHPLGGRNFEYFSEDPYLTGICACEIAKGVQENHPVLVCPKHFAVNEQETFRRGSAGKHYDAVDSILREQAARELYLKPFEMLVKGASVSCLMTSFNKINGLFAGGNKDLCTHILRDEWGYQGVVVTDWGDLDVVVDGADAVIAGNDIVMPGGPPVISQILKGYQEERISREAMEQAVARLLGTIKRIRQHN